MNDKEAEHEDESPETMRKRKRHGQTLVRGEAEHIGENPNSLPGQGPRTDGEPGVAQIPPPGARRGHCPASTEVLRSTFQ